MKYFINCLVILTIFVSSASAANMIVFLHSGAQASYETTAEPRITLSDGVMTIGTDVFELSNVRKYTFAGTADALDKVVENMNINLSYAGNGYVTIQNYNNQQIALYDVMGRSVPCETHRLSNDLVQVDFSAQVPAVYLLSIGNETIKIFKQ